MGFIERLFARLGLVANTDARLDCDEYIPTDPLATPAAAHSAWMSNSLAERVRTGDEACPHFAEAPYGMLDHEPLFRCGDCGLVYRHIVDAAKPWFIRAYQPVGIKR